LGVAKDETCVLAFAGDVIGGRGARGYLIAYADSKILYENRAVRDNSNRN
jgi:hypothetical protein